MKTKNNNLSRAEHPKAILILLGGFTAFFLGFIVQIYWQPIEYFIVHFFLPNQSWHRTQAYSGALSNFLFLVGWVLVLYGIAQKIISKLGNEGQFNRPFDMAIAAQSEDEEGELLKGYYRQVLSQSTIGFIVGIVSSVGGILFIFITYISLDFTSENVNVWSSTVPGIVIEAVSALIIVQTNKSVENARNTMVDLREKRMDSRRIKDALEQVESIGDCAIKNKVKSVMVLHFSGLTVDKDYLREIVMQILSQPPESVFRDSGDC